MWNFGLFDPVSFRAPARKVTRVFLHCTDSDNDDLKGVGLVEEVNRWHLANGWAGVGYHFLVDKAGQVMTGRPLELTPAAQLGEVPLVPPDQVHLGNVATIAISTHGSKAWTPAGMEATRRLCNVIDGVYLAAGARVTFHGHCEIDPRPCPVYRYRALLGLDAAGHFDAVEFTPADMVASLSTVVSDAPHAMPKLGIVDEVEARVGPRNLSEGCRGSDVEDLQRRIGIAPADGWFGAQTARAVMDWQAGHGLEADGVVGPKTRSLLAL
jgi:peptidoglycan hydrolase-like protein with peptidoglycan-binding domain